MKRVSKSGLVLVSLLALTATAMAEPTANGPGNNNGGDQQFVGRPYEQWQSKREFYQKLAKKFHKPKPIPIDPGRGDGHVPVEPAPQAPQGPPGFIFVNGHWERVKAPADGTPQTGTVVVRDHRKVVPGTVVVRDHRTIAPGSVVVRDHRTVTPAGGWQVRPVGPQDVSSSPGGVTVTDSLRRPIKDQSVEVRDHRGRSGNASK
jgi:hypothetical protein